MKASLLNAVTVLGLLLSSAFAAPDYNHGNTIYVRSGQSIQQAINGASPGSKILISAGTYAEQLTITTDGISLLGSPGAVIVPPSKFETNTCTNLTTTIPGIDVTQAGICVTGSDVVLADFVVEHRKVVSVAKPVANVLIQGLEVKNFAGANILVVGAQNTRVIGNRLTNGPVYAFLTDGSVNTVVEQNVATNGPIAKAEDLGFIGLCNDNKAGAEIAQNSVTGYNVAFCIQTNGANIHDNHASGNCIGAYIDPRVNGAKVCDNYIGPTNPFCGYEGVGIIAAGSIDATIERNVVQGQKANGYGAGIVVVDDPCTAAELSCVTNPGEANASGNVVEANVLSNNDLDLYINTTLTNNIVKGNKCSTSSPTGLCKAN